MTLRRLLSLLSGALICLAYGRSALGQDAVLCVSDSAPLSAGRCQRCDGPSTTTFQEAFEAALTLPDVNGSRPSVTICLDSIDVHAESLDVDNTAGRIGLPLSLQMAGVSICPDPTTPADQPLVVWTASPGSDEGASDSISDLEADMRGVICPTRRPGVEVQGWSRLALSGARISGASSYAVGAGIVGGGELAITDSSLLDVRGAAITAGSYVSVVRTEIVGGWVDGTGGARGLITTFGSGAVSLRSSIIHGNVVDGSGGGVTAMLVGQVWLNNTTVSANTVARIPLAVIGYGGRGFAGLGDELVGAFVMKNAVVSRNRRVLAVDSVAFPSSSHGGLAAGSGAAACSGDLQPAAATRPHPAANEPLDSGPLIVVEPAMGLDRQADLVVARSFFVENECGDGPLFDVEASGDLLTVQFLHNTFASNSTGPAIVVSDTRPDGEVQVLANVFSDPTDFAPLAVDGPVRSLMVSGNALASGVTLLPWEGEAEFLIDGPTLRLPDSPFLEPGAVTSLDACGRFAAACPAAAAGDCEAWSAGELPCAMDTAGDYLLSPEWAIASPALWPWGTDFFRQGSGAAWQTPGATGWACDPPRGTADRTLAAGDPNWGDGDGYPDAIDCDNMDPRTIPQLPLRNGYDTADCAPIEGNCFVCPDGSTTGGGGDEDSPPPGTCAPDDPHCVAFGCVGCGTPLIPKSLLAGLLAAAGPWPMRRRRRRTTGSPRAP